MYEKTVFPLNYKVRLQPSLLCKPPGRDDLNEATLEALNAEGHGESVVDAGRNALQARGGTPLG